MRDEPVVYGRQSDEAKFVVDQSTTSSASLRDACRSSAGAKRTQREIAARHGIHRVLRHVGNINSRATNARSSLSVLHGALNQRDSTLFTMNRWQSRLSIPRTPQVMATAPLARCKWVAGMTSHVSPAD